jgi:hypothetical protein
MKNYLKSMNGRRIKLFFISSLLTVFGINQGIAQSLNFSGTWTLNKEQTDFGDQPQWVVPTKYIIEENGQQVNIDKTITDNHSQEIRSRVVLPFDGSSVQVTTSAGTKATNSCSKDSLQNLHIFITLPQSDGEDHITEDWSLINDGKILIIIRNMVQSDGLKYSIKAYYDKR